MKYRKLIVLVLSTLVLASCYNIIPIEENSAVNINDTRQGARSHLYARVPGLSEMRLQTMRADRFNLRFSHTGIFYTETILVEITSDIEDAVIYFTTDGSYPVKGVTSRDNRRYTEPIRIPARTAASAPTVIRARAFLCEEVYSDVLTHTYFVGSDIHSRFDENIYIFLITSDPVHLFDRYQGILVHGALREEWRAANPGVTARPPDPANFNLRGRESERPAYLQVINGRGELVISQSIGIRVRGAFSREAVRHSLALYARTEYDPVFDRFYHDFFRFFDDLTTGRTTIRGTDIPVEAYTQLVLRNGGNDRNSANMREELGQVLARQAGFLDYKGIAPAVMFLNGEYRGFFWLQQFFPEYYFFDHYGEVPRSNIENLQWYEEPCSARIHIDENAFQAYSQLVCLDNYMLYFAFKIYVNNTDWPHNNLRFWRFNGEGGELINRYYDGMFRLLPYDFDMTFQGQGFRDRQIMRVRDRFASFGNLMRRDDMVEKFCNQMFDLINTVFRFDNVYSVFNRIVYLQDPEIRFAISRGVSDTNNQRLNNGRSAILNFARNRAQYVIRDMYRSFGLANEIYNVRVIGKDGASVRLNTLTLDGAGTIESSYFTAHSVRLSADSPRFDHWMINGVRYDTPEVMLNSGKARNGDIIAEVFLR